MSKEVGKMYDAQSAGQYVVNRYRLWKTATVNFEYKKRKAARIAQILRDTGGLEPVALELGVGPGGIAAALSELGIKVVGVDLSPDALERAREHCRSHNVSLLRASGFVLPFPDGIFRLVYASQVLHLFDPPGRLALMREIHRVLTAGGRVVFDMKNKWSHPVRYWTSTRDRQHRNFPPRTQITDLLQHAGFSADAICPGVLPLVGWPKVVNLAVFRQFAHTTFYVARRLPPPHSSLRSDSLNLC